MAARLRPAMLAVPAMLLLAGLGGCLQGLGHGFGLSGDGAAGPVVATTPDANSLSADAAGSVSPQAPWPRNGLAQYPASRDRQAPVVRPLQASDLLGLASADLEQTLGGPQLTLREGDHALVQYIRSECVVYVFLGNDDRVAHVAFSDYAGAAPGTCRSDTRPRVASNN